MRLISVEGNIGAGKSTFLEALKERYANDCRVHFLDEPIQLWEQVKDKYGISMLQKYYSNPTKYAFAFQMMAYTSRVKILRSMIAKLTEMGQNDYVIITERSVHTDKHVFARMLYDEGKIEDVEYQIYTDMFDEFSTKQVDAFIMLKTSPSVSYDRVIKRGRVGEVIPLEYLEKCFDYHEKMLCDMDKTVFDADQDIFENPDVLEEWLVTMDEIINLKTGNGGRFKL